MKNVSKSDKPETHNAFWNTPAEQQLKQLNTTAQGLSNAEAGQRIKRYGANRLNNKKQTGNLRLFLAQFKSSIILILLFATGLSFYLHDRLDAAIILTIVLISGLLGFWQEKGAASVIEKLLEIVQIKVSVLRGGIATEIAAESLIPGDIILLKAGDIIPGDCLILESDNLFIDEAILTGETKTARRVAYRDRLKPAHQRLVDGNACAERRCHSAGGCDRANHGIRQTFPAHQVKSA